MTFFIGFSISWMLLGCISLFICAKKMGYIRWSDLFLIPFGLFWAISPYWWDESGKKLWSKKP